MPVNSPAKFCVPSPLPYDLDGNDVHITVSIGIAPYAPGTNGPDAVLSQADLALYRAKEQGRNQYRFHSDDLDTEVRERVTLTAELRLALERNELELFYQPQVEVLSGTIVGVEALVRWRHPTRGLLVPHDFFAIAEQTGTIMALGHWVLDHACEQMRHWHDAGIAPPLITVNLSMLQLKNARDLVQDVVENLKKWKLKASELEFDVTEATLAQLKWTGNDVLAQLHRLGAQIAIDDFGTEYSSFDYLKSYNVSHLKIARSLIAKALTDPERADMIRLMITMARQLNIGIMAEGVETAEQRELLISTGSPTKAQGFYFSEPVNAENTGTLLRNRPSSRSLLQPRRDRQSEQNAPPQLGNRIGETPSIRAPWPCHDCHGRSARVGPAHPHGSSRGGARHRVHRNSASRRSERGDCLRTRPGTIRTTGPRIECPAWRRTARRKSVSQACHGAYFRSRSGQCCAVLPDRGCGRASSSGRRASRTRKVPCITFDLAQVRSGACTMGVRAHPRIEVLVNRAAAEASGTEFAAVFRFMITEI